RRPDPHRRRTGPCAAPARQAAVWSPCPAWFAPMGTRTRPSVPSAASAAVPCRAGPARTPGRRRGPGRTRPEPASLGIIPRRAAGVSGHDVPQRITVPSAQQDISRSHLELRLEGWHVVALDMGTTNGTTLLRPGMEPVRLRTREGVVLTVGDQIDLGDGIQLLLKEAV